ncbi:NAD(P)-binding protein [Macrolepiota fuliginosa MF-IS2]|uniref:NAD(P)-binding protein n=1 Tax=Macrolepiota fuliginosa MF-IS2 TaxID=1400762 RepID=A0A9P5XDL5_9AGAR|nr:NAD(P)-binding protein [Macrolepiota fuliginosa MF-IS2]
MNLPTTTKAVILRRSTSQEKPVYDDAVLVDKPIPELQPGEVLVKAGAVAFNHRDVWIRKRMYPGIVVGSVFGSDAAGTIVASGMLGDPLIGKRVFLTPSRGWEKDELAPESSFGILGGGALPPIGTFSKYIVVERNQVIPTPEHLDDIQAAAWPLGAVTAWRATMINAAVQRGQNVLITGIGGGVALIAMQLCIAKGASVYVTSGSQEKIRQAIRLGAKGGASYKDANWPVQIASLLKNSTNSELDAVIDSGGGDIMTKVTKSLKQGGRVVCYGMTAAPTITFTMREVLKNQKLLGSTMGSHQDLIDATNFLAQHSIVPHVSHVLDGLESAEEGFELMKRGDQFGKIVIKIRDTQPPRHSKL